MHQRCLRTSDTRLMEASGRAQSFPSLVLHSTHGSRASIPVFESFLQPGQANIRSRGPLFSLKLTFLLDCGRLHQNRLGFFPVGPAVPASVAT